MKKRPQQKVTESQITRSIRQMLQGLQIFVWKVWQGPMSQKGISDILGIEPKTGRLIAIEVKRPGRKASPIQQAFIDRINENGGIGFVATSIDDVIDGLGLRGRFLC